MWVQEIIISTLSIYFGLGLLYGLFFILIDAARVDDHLKNSRFGVRFLLFPGVVFTWPFFILKKFRKHE